MVQAKYQYGTSPRKIEPEFNRKNKKIEVVKRIEKQNVKINIKQREKHIKTTISVVALFLLLLTISCRNSQIDKKFNYIQDQKKQLVALQKENEQLKISIQNSVNIINVEKVAKEELGMQKLSSKQTVYISLPKKDYVESASEKIIIEEEKSWWETLADKFFNF